MFLSSLPSKIIFLFELFNYNIDAFRGNINLNKYWSCNNCGSEIQQAKIFGMIRQALALESREVYLNFDHSWIDKLLVTGSKVVVTSINRQRLSVYKYASMIKHHNVEYDNGIGEIYHILVSLGESITTADMSVIDSFLSNNPCFIPMKDPDVGFMNHLNTTNNFGTTYYSDPRSTIRKLSSSKKSHNHNIPSSTTQHDINHVSSSGNYSDAAIFVQLPRQNFHATCLLYTLITEKQFPKSNCPLPILTTTNESVDNTMRMVTKYTNPKLLGQWLGNIGWSNNVNQVIEHMIDALHNNKVGMAIEIVTI